MARPAKIPFSPDEDEELIRLFSQVFPETLSYAQIARKMGRTRNSIAGRIQALNLPLRKQGGITRKEKHYP